MATLRGRTTGLLTLLVSTAIAASGCAPSLAGLTRLLDASDAKGALASVEGDFARENALAALILKRAAAAGESPLDAVRALAATGRDGRRFLEQLAKGKSAPAAALARIALDRRRPPGDDELEALLADPSADVRAYAVSSWDDEIDSGRLAGLVLDLDPRVRADAVRALGRRGEERFESLLREAARLDPDLRVRSEAARSGRALGGDAVDILRELLGGDDPGVAQAALLGLGDVGSEEAMALLEERALGPLDETAVVAAAELARTGSKKGRARLLEALADERQGIRATAAVNLSRAALEDREELLLDLLDDEAPRVALIAAAMLGNGAHRDRVAAALRRVFEGAGSPGEEARDALAVLGDPAASEEASEALSSADEAEVVLTIRRSKRAPLLRARFVSLLADERPAVRRAAAEAVLVTPKS
ncbi:MAG: HEAT repeat domain-containing protein [Proteobacteria bacterium]|jgi:HEAT repeat protein|nr:HEAT repeat domain-containing protein [Pseudomonadota bacterium]